VPEREEELLAKVRAAAAKDPTAFFQKMLVLRTAGIDPVEIGMLPGNPVTRKVKSPERWAGQQVSNAVAAAEDWLDGVKNPARDPIEASIAAEDKWWDRLQAAKKLNKRVKALQKSSHAEIVEVCETLGTGVYSSGVEARAKKIRRVVEELQPLAQAVSDTIQAMPDKTDAEREKRLITARRLMLQVGEIRAGKRTTLAKPGAT